MWKNSFCMGIPALIGGMLSFTSAAMVRAQTADQARFASADDALKALLEATKAKDRAQLRHVFGTDAKELASGDEVQDQADLDDFANDLAATAQWVREGEEKLILHVGPMDYPFPIPLVRKDGQWHFDTPAGKEELLNRRIGENEIGAIAVCRGCVEAQRDYHAQDWDQDGVIEYAQFISSTRGKKDGLYWETTDDEPASPLGPLVAEAQVAGYGTATTQLAVSPRPYWGYYYKILNRQGERAAGGKYDYVINGHMVAGFAFVAWPANWGQSGVMTFMVNANGKVLEKNLGEKTAELAKEMTQYDPDDAWTPVGD